MLRNRDLTKEENAASFQRVKHLSSTGHMAGDTLLMPYEPVNLNIIPENRSLHASGCALMEFLENDFVYSFEAMSKHKGL